MGGPAALVTEPGGWGPWVDGGGWIRIDGPVDRLYRDLDRLLSIAADCGRGRYAFHQRAGHPLGFPDFAYVGELALGRILADPTGELTEVRDRVPGYPTKLAEALMSGLWRATSWSWWFARPSPEVTPPICRGDTAHLAGCLFRLVGVCAHALHGASRQWLINEKGAVAAAAARPGAVLLCGRVLCCSAAGCSAAPRPDAVLLR